MDRREFDKLFNSFAASVGGVETREQFAIIALTFATSILSDITLPNGFTSDRLIDELESATKVVESLYE